MAALDVINPATGETIAQTPNMSADEVDEVVERAKKALPEWLDATPKERSELLHKLADVIDDNAEELAQIESKNVGKPLLASRDEMPFSRRQPALLRRRGAQPRGQVGGRVHQGLHVDGAPRAARNRRRHLPVELPADDGGLEDGPGARGRQRPDPEAVRADADVAAPVHRAREGRHPGGRAAGRHGRRRADRAAARRAPGHRPRLADRRRRDRQADRAKRVRHPQARAPRARRQGADDHLRRRRRRGGRRRDQARRLLELGPGLHRRLARPRRAEDLRRAARGARAGDRGDQGRRSDGRATRSRWAR